MKKYECVKPFTVDSVDENGATTEDSILIKTGSIWIVEDTDYRIVGADMRLISEKYGWLEISKERLKNYFKIIN